MRGSLSFRIIFLKREDEMKGWRLVCFAVIMTSLIMAGPVWAGNTVYGTNAGGGGNYNTFIGESAGSQNIDGQYNVNLGIFAGFSNQHGSSNTVLGSYAGTNASGSSNVFIGYSAGSYAGGSNRLYIDNCYTGGEFCSAPLIYGEFDNRLVRVDGTLLIGPPAIVSDGKLKQDIEPLKSTLEKVTRLRGVSFNWKPEKKNYAKGFGGKKQIGLIAQEVEAVFPELVYTDEKGMKAVAYDKLGPLVIEAIKELKQINGEQAALIKEKDERIARLEKAVEALTARIAAVENRPRALAAR